MSNNLVIVAIPAQDESVWKVSSEKIPHLTLLFLGDAEKNQNVARIMEFVQHATNIADRGSFMLEVDRRDTLGEDKADVLFFRKDWSLKWVEQFRAQLLQDNDIRAAYESTEQFPEWHPHLTLGYPETPAHEDKIPEHGIHWISFDRIAVWTGNYEGPQFRLEYPERYSDDTELVRWSGMGEDFVENQLEDSMEQTAELGAEFLEHFGVKGMRWGVRKPQPTVETLGRGPFTRISTQPRTGSNITVIKGDDKRFVKKSKTADIFLTLHDRAVKAGDADRAAIDNKPEYKSAKFGFRGKDRNTDLHKKYIDEHYQVYLKNFNAQANKVINEAGTKQYAFREIPNAGKWSAKRELYVKNIEHAIADEPTAIVELLVDSEGKVTGYKIEPIELKDSMAQTVELGIEFLEHYGVKGMRWGVRNRPAPVAVTPSATSVVPRGTKRQTKIKTQGGENHPATLDAIKAAEAKAKLRRSGTAALSNKELRELQERLNLERNVSNLTATTSTFSKGRNFVKGLTGIGKDVNDAGNTFLNTKRLVSQR